MIRGRLSPSGFVSPAGAAFFMWDATPFLLLWWQNVLALWHFMIMETATQSPTVPAPAGEIVRPDPAALAAAELRRLRNEVATLRDLVASLTEGGHR